jgi:hypothetical protein
MHAPSDAEMRRGAVGIGTPKIAEDSKKQKQKYHVAPDSQAALFLLAPMIFLIAILAFAGGLR